MKFVIQCVSRASCTVEGRVTGAIERGYLILVGISDSDTEETAERMLKKTAGLRVFPDENGKTNLSLADIEGSVLLISQFTLYADCRKGNRPSFVKAGKPEHAERLYRYLLDTCRRDGIGKTVEEGVDAALAAGADIVVLCSSDDEYAEYAIPAFKYLNGRAMFVVAGAPACMEDLKAAGIENFVHIKCNVLDTLKEYNQKLGI